MTTPILATLADRFTRDLEHLVNCESPSTDTAALARSAESIARLGTDYLGESPQTIVRDGRPHLLWHFGPADDNRVLILGHHDTVWPVGALTEFPFRVIGDRASGPGSFDMKAGLLQAFGCVATQPNRTGITLLITADEELGAPTSRELIEDHARRSPTTLVFEGSADGGAVKTARKGVSRYTVTVRGRAAHAGLEPWSGVNASVEAAHQILRINRLSGGTAATSTVTPTLVSSGTSANTVPGTATVAVDVRATTSDEQIRIDAALRALTPELSGAELDVVREVSSPPLEQHHTSRLYREFRDIMRTLGKTDPASAMVGGGSDGNYAAGAGSEVLDGIGAIGGGAHGLDEHVTLSATIGRIEPLARLIEQECAR